MSATVLHHITVGVLLDASISGNFTLHVHVVDCAVPLYVAAILHKSYDVVAVFLVPLYVKLVFPFGLNVIFLVSAAFVVCA